MILTREQVAEWQARLRGENFTPAKIDLGDLFDTIDARDAEVAALKAKVERLVAAGDKVRHVHAGEGICSCYLCAAWTAAKEGA